MRHINIAYSAQLYIHGIRRLRCLSEERHSYGHAARVIATAHPSSCLTWLYCRKQVSRVIIYVYLSTATHKGGQWARYMRKSESPKIAVNQPSGYASANSCDYENCYFKEDSASQTDWVLWHNIIRLGSWSCLYLPVQFYQGKLGWRWCSLFWNIWTCFIEVSIGASIPLCIIIGYSKTPLASNLVFMPLHPYIIKKTIPRIR